MLKSPTIFNTLSFKVQSLKYPESLLKVQSLLTVGSHKITYALHYSKKAGHRYIRSKQKADIQQCNYLGPRRPLLC